MPAATIRLFLIHGDPKRLRTAEISNWNGKAFAAPRTEFDLFLKREEGGQSGVYILTGTHPDTEAPTAYIGEAEVLRDRMKAHKDKEFWVQAIAFVSKDENLTKAHIRFLEGRLITEAQQIGRFTLDNGQASGSKLPESDRADMEVFLDKIRQLLPVLGSELLTPIVKHETSAKSTGDLTCTIKGLEAKGNRTSTGFVVYADSHAVLKERPSAAKQHAMVVENRKKLVSNGTLVQDGDHYRFTKNTEFSSPSAAAAVVHGGGANGLLVWKDRRGRPLKEIEEEGSNN
ncbi:MAG: GIY-YIG nuclease family protein [Candidatus Eisenbacteria sp.]|nr:GIY-YIG nuclease family protein [Candidatus Eisenbacteria bacterium]